MSKPYIAGAQSKEYYELSSAQRAVVQKEVDRRFREQTGITRQLDPTSAKDLELRRTWLRIRDEVMNDRESEELRHELDLDGLTAIPEEMRFNGWEQGAQLLETWFERSPTTVPKYSAPVADVIKMNWVLQFARAKSVYDAILKDRIWKNDASLKRIAEILKGRVLPVTGQTLPFGDLARTAPVVDEQWINARPVQNGLAVDGLTAALGAFVFNVAIAARISRRSVVPGFQELVISIEEVGIYVKDSFDFEGSQFLGWWGYRDTDYYNSDFREWRIANHAGGDFRVYSDIKRIKLTSPDVVAIPM